MQEGDKVNLIIGKESPLGFSVLIDESVEGLLYRNEIFQELKEGQSVTGYIKKIRDDERIDVALQPQNFKNIIDTISQKILNALESNDGVLNLTDKSTPEAIKAALQMSKKNFKKGLGNLYKQKIVRIDENAIYLVKK
tara:strand:- start:178994 stop:179407 length:414 start_codon:yes stop_codon:yes gene_type:complete